MAYKDKGKKVTELIDMVSNGMTFENASKRLGIAKSTAARWYYDATNYKPVPHSYVRNYQGHYEAGKDKALSYAGWSDERIADEMYLTVDQLRKFRSDERREEENTMV